MKVGVPRRVGNATTPGPLPEFGPVAPPGHGGGDGPRANDGFQTPTGGATPPGGGGYGPNLRGSYRDAGVCSGDVSASTPVTVAQQDQKIRLTAVALPDEYEEYATWCFQLQAEILRAGVDVVESLEYLSGMESLSYGSLPAPASHKWARLGVKVFAALVSAVEGKAHLEVAKLFQNSVKLGCGRQCLRIFDIHNRFETAKLAARASQSLVSATCKDATHLSGYVANMRHYCFILTEVGAPVPSFMVLEMKNAVGDITQCAATLAQCEAEPFERQTVSRLFDALTKVGRDHKANRADRARATAGAKARGKGDTMVCSHCGKKCHLMAKCWVLNPHLKPTKKPERDGGDNARPKGKARATVARGLGLGWNFTPS